jgi:formate hydrogenlyase subunit 4
LNVLTISAAVATALIPIIFFAVTPTLPEIERKVRAGLAL